MRVKFGAMEGYHEVGFVCIKGFKRFENLFDLNGFQKDLRFSKMLRQLRYQK